jgi:hypothetical protein
VAKRVMERIARPREAGARPTNFASQNLIKNEELKINFVTSSPTTYYLLLTTQTYYLLPTTYYFFPQIGGDKNKKRENCCIVQKMA